jgi:hypothetical protein
MTQKVKTVLFGAGGAITALIFNLGFLQKMIIPDPCYYHTNETNPIFNVFYNLPASEGYHPFPTAFNILLTILIGIGMGMMLHKVIYERRRIAGLIDVSRN